VNAPRGHAQDAAGRAGSAGGAAGRAGSAGGAADSADGDAVGRLWPGQAGAALLLADGALMPYAPWLITDAVLRLVTMFVLLGLGVLVYGLTVRRSGLPRRGTAPAPAASKVIIAAVIGGTLVCSSVIESIHAPLWFPLVAVIAALLFYALHLEARSRLGGQGAGSGS
jgi:hypothetical protein